MRPVAYAAAVAAVAFTLVASSLLSAGCSGSAFTVNGRRVSPDGFHRAVARRIALLKIKDPGGLKGARGKSLERETERSVATEMIRSALLDEQGAKLGVSAAAAAEASKQLEEERAKLGDDAFDKRLATQRLTEPEYRLQIQDKVTVKLLGEKVSAGVTASEDEAESYYLTHKDLFGASAMVHAAHIVFDTEGQAQMVLDQLKSGEDFSKMAGLVSRDVSSRGSGGDMGWIEKGTVDPALEQAAFSLATGQTSGVVKTADGYQIVKVLERRDAYTPPYSEVRDKVMRTLVNTKKDERFSDWLRTLYANASVSVADGVGRWDPALGMVVQKG